MIRRLQLFLLFLAATSFAACGEKDAGHGNEGPHGVHAPGDHDEDEHHDGDHGHDHDGDHDHDDADDDGHGAMVVLGETKVGDATVGVTQYGDVEAGGELALDVDVDGVEVSTVRAWVGVESGQGSMKGRLDAEGHGFHGHVEVPDPLPADSRIWIEIEHEDGKKGRVSFAPGVGHEHVIGTHHGVMAPVSAGGAEVGFVELKLHDDKGDLELWLTQDAEGKRPLDLPLDAIVHVTFAAPDRSVELRVRNTEQNEDEDGTATVRDGKTNYFIFPGASGSDASWLVGADFHAQVTIHFERGGTPHQTGSFLLVPHGAGDHGHDHDHGHEEDEDHDHDEGHEHD